MRSAVMKTTRVKTVATKAAFVFVVFGFVLGCQSYPFDFQAQGTLGASQTDVTISVPSQSDILFVLDNSGSMLPKLTKLKSQVGEFVAALAATGNHFRVGITTIDQQDVTAAGTPAGSCTNPTNAAVGSDSKYNGVCGHLLMPAGKTKPFLEWPSDDFTTPEQMAAAISNPQNTGYADLLSPIGSSWEQPLKGAWLALDPVNRAAGGPDAGSAADGPFFRPDALLVILILTDESDCSFEVGNSAPFVDPTSKITDGDLCYSNASALVPADVWAQRIVERHGGDPRLVAVGVISGAYNDSASNLVQGACAEQVAPTPATDPISPVCYGFNNDPILAQYTPGPQSASTPVCDAVANDRLFTFSQQFASLRDSICRVDYSQALLKLADLADRQCFPTQAPLNNDPSNIEIKLRRSGTTDFNVVPQDPSNGWSYDSNPEPEICLHGTSKRKQGDTVRLFVLDSSKGDTGQPASR